MQKAGKGVESIRNKMESTNQETNNNVAAQPTQQPQYVIPNVVIHNSNSNVNSNVNSSFNFPRKSWLTTLILCIFFGVFGVHRFYTGSVLIGLIQFFTLGGFGIWWIIDLLLIITRGYKDAHGMPLQ